MAYIGDEIKYDAGVLQQMDQLALDILAYSRNMLMVNLRFLDAALHRFDFRPTAGHQGSIATDGTHIYYSAPYILKSYKQQRELPARDLLHMVLHCVFQHPFVGAEVDRRYWDLACDVAIENVINSLGLDSLKTERQLRQRNVISELKDHLNVLTAEKIYHYYMEAGLDDIHLAGMRSDFIGDDHYSWYSYDKEKRDKLQNGYTGTITEGHEVGEDETPDDWETGLDTRADAPGGEDEPTMAPPVITEEESKPVQEIWKDIAEHIQVDLETLSKEWGDRAGGMMQNLKILNRQRVNYTQLLHRFMSLGEEMQISDEDFDYVFYTYGLQLYQRMPLIEPLEYKETRKIKEFVVAIDTSGSCSGEVVQNFVQKTYEILTQEENFFTKVNLHIIMCDAEIQQDIKITHRQQFESYIQNMKILGLGGTDFRPVFEYVAKLQEDREFENLRGLLYFTDGCGVYPADMPPYETAFVFLDDDYDPPEVPPWAIRIVLAKDDLTD